LGCRLVDALLARAGDTPNRLAVFYHLAEPYLAALLGGSAAQHLLGRLAKREIEIS
jgi:hypothetical protein